jgi:uncharacterized protein
MQKAISAASTTLVSGMRRQSISAAADDEQGEVIAFLRNPTSYDAGVERVDVIETHISLVFLAGSRAFKLKRAVRLPYLDFSTVERRREACAAEFALNRRTAPSLYLGVISVRRDPAGAIRFSTQGETLDWVVVMRRFEQSSLFDALARRGKLDGRLIDALADHIADFHARAEPRPAQSTLKALAEVAKTSCQILALATVPGGVFPPEQVETIRVGWNTALAGNQELLESRRRAGKVRHCHGDLHLRNICLLDGAPTLFDCLEFSEALASIDILYDLAFLLMDLMHRSFGGFANRVLNRYLDRTGEDDGLAAMPLFLSPRAGIRAHVTAIARKHAASPEAAAAMADEARAYLALAHRALDPAQCRLVAVGGLSGSGKSTLATALAPEFAPFPGARLLRSDVTRKLLLGVAPETPLPESAYAAEINRQVYEALRRKAAAALAAGYSAVVDAVSLQPEARRALADVGRAAGVPFTGLWLDAASAEMAERLKSRQHDASDATAEVLARQLERDPGVIDWNRIDAGGGPEETLAAARSALIIA